MTARIYLADLPREGVRDLRIARALSPIMQAGAVVETLKRARSVDARTGSWLRLNDEMDRRAAAWTRGLRRWWRAVREDALAAIVEANALMRADDDAVNKGAMDAQFITPEREKQLEATLRELARGDLEAGASSLNMALPFNVDDPTVSSWIDNHVARLVGHISSTDRDELQALIRESIASGKTIGELSAEMREHFDWATRVRSVLIARTETVGTFNFGAIEGMRQGGIQRVEWLSARDSFVRPTHQEADGQIVPVGGLFTVGTATGTHPGAMSEVGENANCRCTVVGVLEE